MMRSLKCLIAAVLAIAAIPASAQVSIYGLPGVTPPLAAGDVFPVSQGVGPSGRVTRKVQFGDMMASPGPIGSVTPSTGRFNLIDFGNQFYLQWQAGAPIIAFAPNDYFAYDTVNNELQFYSNGLQFKITQHGIAAISSISAGDGSTVPGGIFTTPNAGTTGGVQIRANATTSTNYLQFTDNAATSQYGEATVTNNGIFNWSGAVQTHGYTVAGLPTCNGGTQGARAYVNNASSATYSVGASVAGGGTNVIPVFCNGAAWVGG